ncbi:hypothetical protein [Actinomadura sp. 9N215]|uniref:hypothetical protein n=1 Tax=Actinomadura sp. 9N215 TaxID=3375150 RepID=UPI0037A569F9
MSRHVARLERCQRCPVRQVNGQTIIELRVAAEERDQFNAHIIGRIELIHEFHAEPPDTSPNRKPSYPQPVEKGLSFEHATTSSVDQSSHLMLETVWRPTASPGTAAVLNPPPA